MKRSSYLLLFFGVMLLSTAIIAQQQTPSVPSAPSAQQSSGVPIPQMTDAKLYSMLGQAQATIALQAEYIQSLKSENDRLSAELTEARKSQSSTSASAVKKGQ